MNDTVEEVNDALAKSVAEQLRERRTDAIDAAALRSWTALVGFFRTADGLLLDLDKDGVPIPNGGCDEDGRPLPKHGIAMTNGVFYVGGFNEFSTALRHFDAVKRHLGDDEHDLWKEYRAAALRSACETLRALSAVPTEYFESLIRMRITHDQVTVRAMNFARDLVWGHVLLCCCWDPSAAVGDAEVRTTSWSSSVIEDVLACSKTDRAVAVLKLLDGRFVYLRTGRIPPIVKDENGFSEMPGLCGESFVSLSLRRLLYHHAGLGELELMGMDEYGKTSREPDIKHVMKDFAEEKR